MVRSIPLDRSAGWDYLWPQVIGAHEQLLVTHQEVLPILRVCVGELASHGAPPVVSTVSNKRSRSRWQKLGSLLGFLRPDRWLGGGRPSNGAGRVLFVPLFDRSYCLGPCDLVGNQFLGIEPAAEVLMLEPNPMTTHRDSLGSEFVWIVEREISDCFPQVGILLRARSAYREFIKGVESNSLLLDRMEKAYGRWKLTFLIRFLSHYRYLASAARWLERNRITSLVTINDLVGPAAWLYSAACLQGRTTHLIMHGVSGRHNWPFLADRCWVWGEQSFRALQEFGAPEARVAIVGHLETDLLDPGGDWKRGSEGKRTILVLSQIGAVYGWKSDVFSRLFEIARDAAADAEHWRLLIRSHPADGAVGLSEIREICSGRDVEVVISRDQTLEEDLERSDFALTVNSTAVISALLIGMPCAQYFPPDFRERFGEPFLSDKLVVDDAGQLIQLLERPLAEAVGDINANRAAIFSNRGGAARSAAKLLLASPKRYTKASDAKN